MAEGAARMARSSLPARAAAGSIERVVEDLQYGLSGNETERLVEIGGLVHVDYLVESAVKKGFIYRLVPKPKLSCCREAAAG